MESVPRAKTVLPALLTVVLAVSGLDNPAIFFFFLPSKVQLLRLVWVIRLAMAVVHAQLGCVLAKGFGLVWHVKSVCCLINSQSLITV